MRLLGLTNFSATIRIKNTNNLMTIIFLKLGDKFFFITKIYMTVGMNTLKKFTQILQVSFTQFISST